MVKDNSVNNIDGSLARKGFTLVEILVVVSIIALLASILFASFSQARARARDSKRIQDLLEVQKALELYRGKFDEYPVNPKKDDDDENYGLSCWQCADKDYEDPDRLKAIEEFLGQRPCDPSKLDCGIIGESGSDLKGFMYKVNGDCTEYKVAIVATIEKMENMPSKLKDKFFVESGEKEDAISVSSSAISAKWKYYTDVRTDQSCQR